MTRLLSAEISGFRAFSKDHSFDLDADVIILAGPNGSGKTSFFDSILWALSGRLPRFAGHQSHAISLYSPSGTARVELQLVDADGETLTITRTASSEERSDVLVQTASDRLEGAAGEIRIMETFWPAALQTQDSVAAFCMAFTRSVYLQQDLVSEFIESDSEETRFAVLSELVGAGRLNEFLRELESARNAWSRARTERQRELEEANSRVAQITTRLDRLQEPPSADPIADQWAEWWATARALGAAAESPAFEAADASRAVSDALSVLQAERRAAERRRAAAQQLLEEWLAQVNRPSAEASGIAVLRAARAAALTEFERLQTSLSEAQADAARERERLAHLRDAQAELKSLAALALRHLAERCPVCEQEYDIEATRERLQARVERGPDDEQTAVLDRVNKLTSELASAEQNLTEAAAQLLRAEQAESERRTWHEGLQSRVKELQLPDSASHEDLEALATSETDRIEAMGDLYSRGEALALAVARASEVAQRAELEQQLRAAQEVVGERQGVLAIHEQAGETATAILEAGRVAAHEAVDSRVLQIEPLVERIYARMDPHPTFTEVHLATTYPRGHGRVRTLVTDPSAGLKDRDPYTLFSSSQLNALAVSLFLGLNLGTHDAPLRVAMLDDPLQSLDDVNLLGLVDTLRRTKALRQLLVSTHDRRLAQLLQRKLRPVGGDRKTSVLSFAGWTPDEGPTVEPSDVPAEPEEFRIAAA